MTDILLLFSADKAVFARRLADAIGGSGYSVKLEVTGGSATSQQLKMGVAAAAAVVATWSRSSMASDAFQGAVAAARRQDKVIEVSPDGLMPVASSYDGRVALLSGWRGGPHHQGWKKVSAELNRICGKPDQSTTQAKKPTGRPDRASPAHSAKPSTGDSQNGSVASIFKPRGKAAVWALVAFALSLCLILGAVGLTRSAQDEGPDNAVAVKVPAATPAPAAQRTTAPVAAVPTAMTAAGAGAAPPGLAPVGRESTATQTQNTSRSTLAPERRSAASQSGERPKDFGARRYSRRNSRNMQRFCERSGRRTAECRAFTQQAWGALAAAPPRSYSAPMRYRNDRIMRLFCAGSGRSTPQCRTFRRRMRTDG
jgi:hypothetical protein